jgi:putative ABC transport system permease protein
VDRAGFIHILHLGGDTWTNAIALDDSPVGDELAASVRTVTPDLFETLSIPILRGRSFEAGDATTAQPVAIVNRAFASQAWPDADAVGKRVKRGGLDSSDAWRTVVGVVGDVHQDTITAPVRPEIYFPYAQNPFAWARGTTLVVRGQVQQPGFLAGVRRAVWSIDPELPLTRVRTASQLLDDLVARERFTTWLLAAFAAAALALALIGIHGVIAYGVRRRTRELGIRVALGATRGEVLGLVARQGLALAGLGTLVGLAGAVAGSRALESLLFGVTATEPAIIGTVAAFLLAAAALACLLAARPATRVDPAVALRQD